MQPEPAMRDNLAVFGDEPAGTPIDASSCPTPHTVALFCGYAFGKPVRGEGSGLSRDKVDQISRHMRECSRCAGRFKAIVDVSREPGDGVVALVWPGPAIAVAALITAALALMFMVFAESMTDPPHSPADKFGRSATLNIQRSPQFESHNVLGQMQSQPLPQPSASRSSRLASRVPRAHDRVSGPAHVSRASIDESEEPDPPAPATSTDHIR